MKNTISLGDKVQDTITGFIGIVVTKVEHLNGCVNYGVKPKMKAEDKLPETEFFDQAQLKVLGSKTRHRPSGKGGLSKDLPRKESLKF